MANLWDSFLDTASDVVDSIGTNAQASSTFEQAKADALKARTSLLAAETAASIAERQKRQELIQYVVVGAFAVVIVVVVANVLLKLRKT